jgi:hypothetical protein
MKPETTKAFWAFMCETYKTRAKYKADSWLMRTIARVLDWLGYIDSEEFMTKFTTTIGETLYTPLERDVGVCVHEHVHVRQSRQDLLYPVKYLVSSKARVYYEIEAYCATMEMQYYLTGELSSPEEYVNILRGYGCSVNDLDTARTRYFEAQDRIKKGVISTPESVAAIAWLREFPEPR